MKSKKQLFIALDKFFDTDKYTKNQLKAVHNETYGRESMIYVDTDSINQRTELLLFLTLLGFNVTSYRGHNDRTVEVQVSYFKGNKWSV